MFIKRYNKDLPHSSESVISSWLSVLIGSKVQYHKWNVAILHFKKHVFRSPFL